MKICAVIPARDEEATIARTVLSLRNQTWSSDLEVLVVDDHSSDATAQLALNAGATVISAPPLPAGWTGKLWAVSQGVERALEGKPDFILLTDADIEHAPDSLAALVSRAEAWNLDLASFMVRLSTHNPAERLAIPAFVYFFLKLYPPRWIALPNAHTAGAAGGCILIRPKALERIGGIQSIRGELIDDCALAARVKRGGRIWMGLTSTTTSIRQYAGLAEIRAVIARTAYTQLRHSPLLLAGTVVGMLLTYVAPIAAIFMPQAIGKILGAAAWLLMSLSYLPTLRFYRLSPAWTLALPLVAVLYSVATIESAVRYWLGKGGAWKGRLQDSREPL